MRPSLTIALNKLLNWKLAQQLLLLLEKFTPISVFLRLFISELRAHTEQTDGRTETSNAAYKNANMKKYEMQKISANDFPN